MTPPDPTRRAYNRGQQRKSGPQQASRLPRYLKRAGAAFGEYIRPGDWVRVRRGEDEVEACVKSIQAAMTMTRPRLTWTITLDLAGLPTVRAEGVLGRVEE